MKQRSGKYNNPILATVQGISDLFKQHERVGSLSEEDRLDGKTILITGASSGLGFATAVDLARRGATLWLACRSGIPEKGEEIKHLSGSQKVHMLPVDLADLGSIQHLVRKLSEKHIKLDRLICNAAMVPSKSRKTPQGQEEMFVVNYLSKFYLIHLLLDAGVLSRSTVQRSVRIVIVSSESHRNPAEFEWEKFGKYQEYGMGQTVALYGYYKLLLSTFAQELSRRLNIENANTTPVLVLCPGPVNSNIAREAPSIFQPLLKGIFGLFFKAPEKAAEPVVYLSTTEAVANKAFDYLFLMGRKEMDELATHPPNGSMLWDRSEALLQELGFPPPTLSNQQ